MLIGILLVAIGAAIIIASYLTDAFNRFTIVKMPLRIDRLDRLPPHELERLQVRQAIWWRWFAIIKCGVHIMHTRYLSSPRSHATTVEGVIKDIRRHRFRPDRLLLISGDHFNGLFVRNLGVFYYPTLDRAIADSGSDWRDRQIVYLQSVAYALGVFSKYPLPTTTIVPTGPRAATCINFYAYPSDTVYGIFYALAAARGLETAQPYHYAPDHHELETATLADQLATDFKPTLRALYAHYRAFAYDEASGLISTAVHMSGAKDITRRSCAFYDNVIFWKTSQLAMRLGLIKTDEAFLAALKQRILTTFWLEDKGYFLEDLSAEGTAGSYYSSDWLIVLATGFLDLANEAERRYYQRSVDYIRRHDIDQPLPIRYQHETRAHRQFFAVRLAVASYGGEAIWSFWGMEYIKVLLGLYRQTEQADYLQQADLHIGTYRQLIVRHGGFPEVYDSQGELLQTPLYRSIRQTGWVIGFEQVLAIRQSITQSVSPEK